MCRNSSEFRVRSLELKVIRIFIFLFFTIFTTAAYAEPLKVSLLLGDTHSRTAIEAIKLVRSHDISFHVYPSKDIRGRDLKHLRESKLVIINIMGRQLVNTVKPEIEEAIKNGAKVYAVAASGSYNDEAKKLGILFDKNIEEFFKH